MGEPRSSDLHETALSPAEYDCWMPWLDSIRASVPSMTYSQLLDTCWSFYSSETGPARSARLDKEILGFLKHSETAPTQGNALAIVRLIHHARLGGLLCRDHIFLQCPEPTKPSSQPKPSNPFRAGATVQRPTPQRLDAPLRSPEMRAASNPHPSGTLSSPGNPFRRVSAPLINSGVPPATAPMSPGATSSNGPPLPPRSKPAPPPPPPTRSAPSTSKPHSVNIISSSDRSKTHASSDPNVETHGMHGFAPSEKRKKPPPAAPKPKLGLVSSTHISPETNMRPIISTKSSTDTLNSAFLRAEPSAAASRPGSSSSASINPPAETPTPSNLNRSQSLHIPPPPKRRPDLVSKGLWSPDSAPAPGDFRSTLMPAHHRTKSLSQGGRYGVGRSGVTPTGYNPTHLQRHDSNSAAEFTTRIGRVFAENEEFQRTSEWVQKAKESIEESVVARNGRPTEREALLQQQRTAESTSTSTSSGLSASGDSLNKPNQHQHELARLRTQSEQGWTQL